jgi:poly(beta-D-mannuronate) lyase
VIAVQAQPLSRLGLAIASVLAGSVSLAAEPPLRSPFTSPGVPEAGRYGCAPPPAPVFDLEGESPYGDAAHSVVDPSAAARNREAFGPIGRFTAGVVRAADHAYAGGPGAVEAARCALAWLSSWAEAKALSGRINNQGGYERKWNLAGLSLAYVKLASTPGLDERRRNFVERWLNDTARSVMPSYERPQRNDNNNNHAYWAGLAVAAAGVASDDRELFDWGIARYRLGIGQIAEDGTLPLEMARKSQALHYHLFALTPLVFLAELGRENGLDLYGERSDALHRLVDRALKGLDDPAWFAQRAGAEQTAASRLARDDLPWMEAYRRRFGDRRLEPWLDRYRPIKSPYLGGDVTAAFAPK